MSVIEQTELEAAIQEHAEARAAWQRVNGIESQLMRGRVLLTTDLSTGEKRRRELDDVERAAMLAEIQADKSKGGGRLLAAREKLAAAKREAANAELPELVETWRAAAAAAAQKRVEVERRLAGFLLSVWKWQEAQEAEAFAARRPYVAAASALDDGEREELKTRIAYEVPVRVDEDSVESLERPARGLFGADAFSGRRIGELLAMDARHARGELQDTALGALIEQIENEVK